MPKYVCIAAHISIGELENRYRKATDPVERSHFQIIWLLAQGKRVREVSEVTGYCANWIRILARRYNQKGPLAMTDQRQHNRGAIPLLSKDQQEQLQHILEETASDGGLWTGRKVALWMGKQTRRKIHAQRGWDYLKRLDFSLLIPRPRHHKSNKEQQEAFKQALPEEVQHLQQIYPQAKIGLWCMDEHRIGLKPVVRRIWARKGHRPVIRVQQRYEWLYVYGFAHPESGESHWLLLPSVSVEVFTIALEHFAQAVGASPDRRIIVVLDRAGWHSSQMLVIPDGIQLVFLPPYSPELQRMSSASGHSPTRRLAIAALRRWMSYKRSKQSAVLPFKTMRPVSAMPHSSTGGLPRSCKRDLTVSNPIFQQSPLFVSLTHLRDISLRS